MSKRALLIVLDSLGIGWAPDADEYGDKGANTFKHIADKYLENDLDFKIPNLIEWGIDRIVDLPQDFKTPDKYLAKVAKLLPKSKGKDTTTGHWEMCGLILDKPFATYTETGFPDEILNKLKKATGYDFLGNYAASGTVIIEDLGEEHIKTGKPILYTSADSVIQIAAHEDIISVPELYNICAKARKIADEYQIGRVIARPFEGTPGNFTRTSRRHDYSILPKGLTILDHMNKNDISVTGVGKIYDIFAGQGINQSIKTAGNTEGIKVTLEQWKSMKSGFLFVNLVDFDMLYGHRNNWKGYGEAIMEFDKMLPELLNLTAKNDVIMITADHGNDPTYPGTDHTREAVPFLMYSPNIEPIKLPNSDTFADISATLADFFGFKTSLPGKSLL